MKLYNDSPFQNVGYVIVPFPGKSPLTMPYILQGPALACRERSPGSSAETCRTAKEKIYKTHSGFKIELPQQVTRKNRYQPKIIK